jgi:hypothetical protein
LAIAAFPDRVVLASAVATVTRAEVVWLVPGAAAIGALYEWRALVYRSPLRLLQYSFS